MTISQHPVVLVTGASRGIGLSVTSLLLKGTKTLPCSNVVTISRSLPDTLEDLQRKQKSSKEGTSLIIYQGDVCNDDDNKAAIDKAVKEWGRLDAVVLNAGVIEFARIADVTPSSFAQQIAINVSSLVNTLHYAIPHLRQSPTGCGKAVFVSSGASIGNTATWSAYNASKAAMNAIARTLATEEDQIASWAIRPGVVATDMQGQVRNTGKGVMSEADFQKFSTMHSEGKLLHPDQPGHVLAALAVRGTRSEPKDLDGQSGAGEKGAFINWNDDVMSDFQLPQ